MRLILFNNELKVSISFISYFYSFKSSLRNIDLIYIKSSVRLGHVTFFIYHVSRHVIHIPDWRNMKWCRQNLYRISFESDVLTTNIPFKYILWIISNATSTTLLFIYSYKEHLKPHIFVSIYTILLTQFVKSQIYRRMLVSKMHHFYKRHNFIYIHDNNLKRTKYINTDCNQKPKKKYRTLRAKNKRVKKPWRCASQF